MKDNLKKILKDKKSLFMIGYSVFLITVFIVGGIATPGAIETVNRMLYAPVDGDFSDNAMYECVIDSYNRENPGAHKTISSVLTDSEYESITELNCPGYGITSLRGITKLTNLKKALLSNNDLTTATLYTGTLTKLEEFDLSNNKIIAYTSAASATPNLKKLNLANNQMTQFSNITGMSNIEDLNLSNNKIVDIDLTNLSKLEALDISNNKLKKLNLSKNTKLTTDKINISNDTFENDTYIYVGNSSNNKPVSAVKLPSSIDAGNINWSLDSTSIQGSSIDDNGIVHASSTGTMVVSGSVDNLYTTKSNIHVVELTSDDSRFKFYNDYLWVGTAAGFTEEETLEKLSEKTDNLGNLDISIRYESDDYLFHDVNALNDDAYLIVKDKENDITIESMPVYGATLHAPVPYTDYNVDKDVLYVGGAWDSRVTVKKSPALTLEKDLYSEHPRVWFTDGTKEIKSFDIASWSSTKYNLSNPYRIYVGTESLDPSQIKLYNADYRYYEHDNNYNTSGAFEYKIVPTTGEGTYQKWDVIKTKSNHYDIGNNYINTKGMDFDTDKIKVSKGSVEKDDDNAKIKYGNEVLDTLPIVSFEMNDGYEKYYDKDYIDYGTKIINEGNASYAIKNSLSNCSISGSGNQISIIKSDSETVYKTWDIVNYTSDKYDLSGDYIYVGANDTFDTIQANIQVNINTKLVPIMNENGDLDAIQIRYKTEDGQLIKTLSVVSASSDYYDLSSKYIFTGSESNDFIKSKFNLTGSHLDFEGNKLVLKADNEEGTTIKTWNLVKCSSDHYYISNKFVYYKNASRDYQNGDITITSDNATVLGVEDNVLKIKQKDNTVVELPKVYLSSSSRDLNNEYVYVGYTGVISDLQIHYGDEIIPNNNSQGIRVSYDTNNKKMNVVLETGKTGDSEYKYDTMNTIKLFSLATNDYEIGNHVILVINKDFKKSDIWLNSSNTGYSLEYSQNDKILSLMYNGQVVDEWRIITIKSSKYHISKTRRGDFYIDTNGLDFSQSDVDINATDQEITYSEQNRQLVIRYTTRYGFSSVTLGVITYTSSDYDLNENYINVRTGEFNDSLIDAPGCTKTIEGQPNQDGYKFLLLYKGAIIKSWDIVGYKYTLDKYNDQLEDGYLFFDNDEVTAQLQTYNCTARISNDILKFKLNNSDEYLEQEYPILKYTSTKYDLTKKYINFPDENVNDLYDNITFNNEDLRLKDYDDSGYIYLYYKDKKVKQWYYTSYSSDKYNLDKDYIFETGESPTDHIINNKWHLNFIDNTLILEDDQHSPIRTWDYITLSVSEYSIGNDYIIIGTDDNLDVSKVSFSSKNNDRLDKRVNENGDLEIVDNNSGDIIKTLKTIKYSSTVYDLSKPYIAANGKVDIMFNTTADEVNVDKGDKKVNLIYNDKTIKTWDLLMIESSKYYISDNYIYVGDKGFSEENLTLTNMKVKQINDTNNNGILGDVGDVVVFENTTSGYSYETSKTISDDYINFDNVVIVDNIIKNIKDGTKVDDLSDYIHTSGTITVKDSTGAVVTDNRILHTGDTVQISLSDTQSTYVIAVRGDVTGDGIIDMADVNRLLRHYVSIIIPSKTDYRIPDNEYYRIIAGDVNNGGIGDGVIDMADVNTLLRHYRGTIPPGKPEYLLTFIVNNIFKIGGIA